MRHIKAADLASQLRSLTEPVEVTSYGKVIATVYPKGSETIQVGMTCGHEALIEEQAARIRAMSQTDVGSVICERVTTYLRSHRLLRSDARLTYTDGRVAIQTDSVVDSSFGHPTAVPKPGSKK
jgi:hypothetical protein